MDIGCVKQLVLGFFSDFPTIFLHQKIAFWVELGSVKMRFFQHTCHLWLSPKKNISGHGIQELSDCKLYKIILWMLAQWPKGMVRCETTCQLVKLLMNTYPPVDRGMHLLDLVMFISLVWLEGLAVLLLSLMSAVFTPHSRITIRNTCNQIPNYGCASWSLTGKPKKKNLATAQRLEQLRVVWHAEFEELAARSPVEAQPKGG